MRLFFAVGLGEAVKDALCAAMERMRPCCGQGRFTARANLHLTLVFLGEVPPGRLPGLKKAMEEVSATDFDLQIGGMGCSRQRGGYLYWAGVERSVPLLSLYDSLCGALRRHGFEVEERAYRPHLTLVRQAVLRENCDRSVLTVPISQSRAESFSLMLSQRQNGSPVYTELCRKKLLEEA